MSTLARRYPARSTWVEPGIVWSTRTGPWLWVRIPELHYDGLTADQQIAEMRKLEACLHAIGQGEAHLLAVEQPPAAAAEPWTHGPPRNTWRTYAREQADWITGQRFLTRAVFLGVRLNRFRVGPLAQLVNAAVTRAGAGASTSRSERDRVGFVEQANLLHTRLAATGLRVTPATVDELARLVARPCWLTLDRAAETIAGVIEPKHWHAVRICQPRGDLWVTTLTLAATNFRDFPDGAWLLPRADLPFQPDISIRFDVVPSAEQARLFGHIHQVIADQIRNITGGTERDDDPAVSISLAEQLDTTRQLEHDVRIERTPWVHPTVSVTFGAATREELADRVEQVVGSFEADGATLRRLGPDQWALLHEQIPGERWKVRGGLVRRWPATTLAGGMPHASMVLGMGAGPYLGHSTWLVRTPVFLDPIGLARQNLATAIVLTGEPGSGKSATAKKIIAECALRGAWVVVLDPQREYGLLVQLLTALGIRVQLVTFGRDTPGTIDAWVVHRAEPGAAAGLAVELVKIMLPSIEGTMVETYLAGLAKEVSDGPTPSMRRFVDAMVAHANDDVAAAGRAIAAYAEHPLARLFFDQGEAVAIDIADAVTVLQWQGLELPEDGVNTTTGHRLSSAVLHATAALVRSMLDTDERDAPKLLAFDEAHQFTRSPAGRSITAGSTRGGRKVDLATLLITQNVEHLGDPSILNNVRVALCFRSGDPAEQAGVCRVLRRGHQAGEGHDARWVGDPDIMGRLGGLADGECFLRDPSGRVGMVQVDHTSRALEAAAQTTPTGAPTAA